MSHICLLVGQKCCVHHNACEATELFVMYVCVCHLFACMTIVPALRCVSYDSFVLRIALVRFFDAASLLVSLSLLFYY